MRLQRTTDGTILPRLSQQLLTVGAAGTPSKLRRAGREGLAFLPHLSLLQLLLLLHLQFFGFKDDRKNQNHKGGGPNPQSCPRESIKEKEP